MQLDSLSDPIAYKLAVNSDDQVALYKISWLALNDNYFVILG